MTRISGLSSATGSSSVARCGENSMVHDKSVGLNVECGLGSVVIIQALPNFLACAE
jgi:hypothetical protein